MRGSTMSSANLVCPVHFERASTLRKGRPTTLRALPAAASPPGRLSFLFVAIDALSGEFPFFAAQAGGGQFDGLVNFDVAGAPAQVSAQRLPDLVARRRGIGREQL